MPQREAPDTTSVASGPQNNQHVAKQSFEAAVRSELKPLAGELLPLMRDIADATASVRERELVHMARVEALLRSEVDEVHEFLRNDSLLPKFFRLIDEDLRMAEKKGSADPPRVVAENATGDASLILIGSIAEALRNVEVVDRLAQLRVAERLLEMMRQE